MKAPRLSWLLLVLSLWMLQGARPLVADGLVRDGIGAISMGRGGTNIAHSDNGVILLDNPAGMVNATVSGYWEIGAEALVADLDYSDPQNPHVDNRFKIYPSGNLSYINKSDDGSWAWGIGIFAPAGFGAEYEMNHPVVGPSLYKSFGALGKILPGLAVQVTDQLSVGGTLGVGLSHAELEGPFNLQTGALSGAQTNLDLQTTGAAVVGSIGLQYQWTDCTTVGLCYTEESRFRLNGNASADIYGFGPTLHSNFDAQLDLVWPRSLGVGIKHDLGNCRRISADVIWYNWSHAFDRLDLRLTNPDNIVIAGLTGGTLTDSYPLAWKDTVSLRLGYEWENSRGTIWRVGYAFHDSPVPNATLNPYIDGVLEHAFTTGFSYRASCCILSAAYEYSFGPERHIGTSDIVGGDFDNSTFQAQAHWLSLSLLVPF